MANSKKCPLEDLKYEKTLREAVIYGGNYLVEGVVALQFKERTGMCEVYDPYGWLNQLTPLDDTITSLLKRVEDMDTNRPVVWGLVFVDDDGVFLQESAETIEGLLHKPLQATITTKNVDLVHGLHIVRVEKRCAAEFEKEKLYMYNAQCRLNPELDSHGQVFYR